MFSSRLVPVTVAEELEKIVRLFLWGSKDGIRKIHLVSFEGICLPRELGGLGIKRVREINLSLLCKWFWRLKENRLWVRLLKEKYGTKIGGFFPRMSRLPVGISVWRGLTLVLPLFKSLSRWKVGNGSFISFWHDRWCSPYPLSRLFLDLYIAANTKNFTVSELLSALGSGFFGNCLGTNHVLNGPMAFMVAELNRCYSYVSLSSDPDELAWVQNCDSLSVSNCYSNLLWLRRLFFDPGVMFFQWEKVWIHGLPSKVSFLLWLIVRDRVLTHNNLQRRGFSIVSQCLLCHNASEDVDHLFCNCEFTREVWDYFSLNLNGFSVRERIANWSTFGLTQHGRLLRSFLPHAICWCLWVERNQRCFEERGRSLQQVFSVIKETVWGWYLDSMLGNKVRLDRVMFDWHAL